MRVAPQIDSRRPVTGEVVIVGEFLALPKHGYALRRVQRDGQRLQARKTAAIAGRERTASGSAREYDQMAVVVRVQILERCDRHVDWSACCVDNGFRARIAAVKKRVKHVREVVRGRAAGGDRFGLV